MRFSRFVLILVASLQAAPAGSQSANTDWFHAAKYGVFMHFLPENSTQLLQVEKFDEKYLAKQLEEGGAGYFVITLGQNSGCFIAPNAVYGKFTGYGPGERCSKRDLPSDLFSALQPKGIRLLLYLPCQVPNQDARAQRAFGLREGPQDQPLSIPFAQKWARVIEEWADHYGDKVSGWWFDGGYEHIGFNNEIAVLYAAAVHHGNPKAIVTFNPGVKVIRWTEAEEYTAGELNEPLKIVPESRWLNGSQWHALTYLGSTWAKQDTRFNAEQCANWVDAVTTRGGVVTLDMGPSWVGAPVGSLASGQFEQLKTIRGKVRK